MVITDEAKYLAILDEPGSKINVTKEAVRIRGAEKTSLVGAGGKYSAPRGSYIADAEDGREQLDYLTGKNALLKM
jgi:hypothetical protein